MAAPPAPSGPSSGDEKEALPSPLHSATATPAAPQPAAGTPEAVTRMQSSAAVTPDPAPAYATNTPPAPSAASARSLAAKPGGEIARPAHGSPGSASPAASM